MVESQRDFEEIFDLIGIRIITADTRGCYAALGLVHSKWVPISGRFKDFVAMPKVNLYQSLHTTVIGPDGKPLEVQIRTAEMHRLAESGIAAHWRYKEGPSAMDIPWVGDIRTLLETEDPQEFLTNLKLDFYQDEVFVLTPAGDVKTLPRGSTAIDFAYAVHTEVGNRCVGTRINGTPAPSIEQARVRRHRRGHHLQGQRRRSQPRLAELRHHLAGQSQDQGLLPQGAARAGPG